MKLGPDALDPRFKAADFAALLEGRSQPIKLLLMDQSKLAGIGNTWSDEILFQARIDPATPAGTLDTAHRRALFRAIRSVLREAIERDPSTEGFSRTVADPGFAAASPSRWSLPPLRRAN